MLQHNGWWPAIARAFRNCGVQMSDAPSLRPVVRPFSVKATALLLKEPVAAP